MYLVMMSCERDKNLLLVPAGLGMIACFSCNHRCSVDEMSTSAYPLLLVHHASCCCLCAVAAVHLQPDGNTKDTKSLHAGCPVIKGVSRVANADSTSTGILQQVAERICHQDAMLQLYRSPIMKTLNAACVSRGTLHACRRH